MSVKWRAAVGQTCSAQTVVFFLLFVFLINNPSVINMCSLRPLTILFPSSLSQHRSNFTWQHRTKKHFAVAPHRLTQHAHDTSHVVGGVAGFERTSRRTMTPRGGHQCSSGPGQPEEASGHALGCALLLRGIGTLVWVRRRVQEVAAHVQGEGQQAAVQVHHHVLLCEDEEEGLRRCAQGLEPSHKNQ